MNTPPVGYSADVRIHLLVNGAVLPVAQLGPDFLILRTPLDCPACEAEITMSIDGHESRWTVSLPEGIQVARQKTAIARSANAIPVTPVGEETDA
jgi:hypothetical protein